MWLIVFRHIFRGVPGAKIADIDLEQLNCGLPVKVTLNCNNREYEIDSTSVGFQGPKRA